MFSKILFCFIILLISSCLCATVIAPRTYYVHVGWEANDGWSLNNFYPQDITISAGDSITFLNYGMGHIVVFTTSTFPIIIDVVSRSYQGAMYPQGGKEVVSQDMTYSSGFLTMGTNYTFRFPFEGTDMHW